MESLFDGSWTIVQYRHIKKENIRQVRVLVCTDLRIKGDIRISVIERPNSLSGIVLGFSEKIPSWVGIEPVQ